MPAPDAARRQAFHRVVAYAGAFQLGWRDSAHLDKKVAIA
jgi:hypothetical protein